MPKVLLIEDDETMSSLLTILLQFEGYAVSTSTDDSPNDLFEAMRRDKPDVKGMASRYYVRCVTLLICRIFMC
jgi:DNA-binding response OmpR family regulator